MPRRDGTGPMGRGTMSGRGFGPCAGTNAVKYGASLGLGLLLRCRRGFGRGFGGNYFGGNSNIDQASSKTQKEFLQEQKDALQSRLEVIKKQLENL